MTLISLKVNKLISVVFQTLFFICLLKCNFVFIKHYSKLVLTKHTETIREYSKYRDNNYLQNQYFDEYKFWKAELESQAFEEVNSPRKVKCYLSPGKVWCYLTAWCLHLKCFERCHGINCLKNGVVRPNCTVALSYT